jgi:hypothetical protein
VKFNKNIHKKEPWITKGILTSRLTKFELEKNHSINPTHGNWTQFKTYRNIYNKVIRASKKQHYCNSLEANSKNLKKTWSILNEVLKKGKPRQPITSIFHEDKLVSDPKQIANIFNKFFTTIAVEIASLINPTNTPDTPNDHAADDLNDDMTVFKMSDTPVRVMKFSDVSNNLLTKDTRHDRTLY